MVLNVCQVTLARVVQIVVENMAGTESEALHAGMETCRLCIAIDDLLFLTQCEFGHGDEVMSQHMGH